ncbi:helix-turn-helix transcriptional regulator [bacterium]|nr:helix-turn-helix transcriptional regulator [bacterium]
MQYKNLGLFIKNRRLDAGYTLNSFAIQNDIEPAILSRIENIKQDIKLGVLIKIAAGFKQTPSEFLLEFENYIQAKKHR